MAFEPGCRSDERSSFGQGPVSSRQTIARSRMLTVPLPVVKWMQREDRSDESTRPTRPNRRDIVIVRTKKRDLEDRDVRYEIERRCVP